MAEYDFIILGTGAGGGTLLHMLAKAGKKILVIERGGFLKREPQNWDTKSVFIDNRYISPDEWEDKTGKRFQPQVHYYVGGATKLYGAALYRLREQDFGEIKHYDGTSPAWPLSYQDFEPYYQKAEELFSVHGEAHEDPTDPPRSKSYPYPPVFHEPRIQKIADRLKEAGYHPFHAPCAIRLNEKKPDFSPCIRCKTCDGFPCLLHAKADAETAAVRPIWEYENVTFMLHAEAKKLLTDPSGKKITSVEVLVNGKSEFFSADTVIVSCGAANSAKLLLASKNALFPTGLANSSSLVGRNYMFHNSQAVLALSLEPNPTVFQKTLAINDFYFQGKDFPYPLGNIQMLGKSQGLMFRGEKPLETLLAPNFLLEDIAEHAVDFWLTTEDLPSYDNRVTLTTEGQIRLEYTPNNQIPKKKLFEHLKSMLKTMEMHEDHLIPYEAYLKTDIPVAGVAHQAGTCRFGKDPKTSVLDINCRAHDHENLYVVDTSFFPSIGAVNPSLTAIANALRVADHFIQGK